MSILIWIQLEFFFSPDDRERNAASETMSLRMLMNLAFLCAVMSVVKKCCHLSASLGVVCVRGLATHRESHFSSVNCGRKLWGRLATAELSLCGPRKPTMSTNKTKKVKMATKSCPECDQQVRQYMFKFDCKRFWFCFLTVVPNVINDAQLSDKNGAAWLHTCKH